MITKEEVESIGFVPYTGGPVRGVDSKEFHMNRVGSLGWNIGIDLDSNKCFYFEGDRPSVYPYPVPATVITQFHYPETLQDLKGIYWSLTGVRL